MDARRLIPVGLAVAALLAVAGIASHGRPLTPGHGAGPDATFFDYVATTLVLVAIAVVVIVVWAVRGNATAAGLPLGRGRRRLWSSLVFVGLSLAIAELILHSRFQLHLQHLQLGKQPTGRPVTQKPVGTVGGRNARIRWDEVAVVALLVGGVLAYFLLTRAARKPLRALPRRRDTVTRALDESLDDLRSDPDIRRAIIAAYARMEYALGGIGLVRDPAEAPFEYLARSLVELDASAAAAERLTALFERAKFSHHAPDEQMRTEAIDALVAVRDDVTAVPA